MSSKALERGSEGGMGLPGAELSVGLSGAELSVGLSGAELSVELGSRPPTSRPERSFELCSAAQGSEQQAARTCTGGCSNAAGPRVLAERPSPFKQTEPGIGGGATVYKEVGCKGFRGLQGVQGAAACWS